MALCYRLHGEDSDMIWSGYTLANNSGKRGAVVTLGLIRSRTVSLATLVSGHNRVKSANKLVLENCMSTNRTLKLL
jgi:hypothetical protein